MSSSPPSPAITSSSNPSARATYGHAAPSASTIAADWNSDKYLRFADERTRPARDLLAGLPRLANWSLARGPLRIPTPARPLRIVDLGCGPGNSTALLALRFAGGNGRLAPRITGVDASPNMLAAARRALPQPGVEFVLADLRSWEPGPEDAFAAGEERVGGDAGGATVDLFFSNAALHWLPDAELLPALRRWIGGRHLRSGGVFAMQVPDNVREPSHVLMGETARSMGLGDEVAGRGRAPFPEPRTLVEELGPLCESVDVWHTVYNHRLETGAEGILDWFRESGLKPFLDAMESDAQRTAFEAKYLEALREAYPPLSGGSVLLRFPRLFMVAVRK